MSCCESCRTISVDLPELVTGAEFYDVVECQRSCDNKLVVRANTDDPNDPNSPWLGGLQLRVYEYSCAENVYPPRLGTPWNMPSSFNRNAGSCISCPSDCMFYLFRFSNFQVPGSNPIIMICEDTCCCSGTKSSHVAG